MLMRLLSAFALTHAFLTLAYAQPSELRSRLDSTEEGPALVDWVAEVPKSTSERVGYARLEKSSGKARTLDFQISAKTLVARTKLKLNALEEGFSPLLAWDEIRLAVSYEDGVWQLYQIADNLKDWKPTEFTLAGQESHLWLNLDIVRQHEGIFDRYYVFINGSLISDMGYTIETVATGTSELKVAQLTFGEVKLADIEQLENYPGFALRAFRYAGTAEYNENAPIGSRWQVAQSEEPRAAAKVASDTERKTKTSYQHLRRPLAAGDLSYLEEVWAVSMTVNRTYYAGVDGFRLNTPWLDEPRLVLKGADYLPTLESRGWAEPFSYTGYGENYIEKVYGYIVPHASGEYRFWLAGDEEAAFFLSTSASDDPGELALLSEVTQATARYQWNAQSSQASALIELEAGVPYYFELWHLENNGDDHIAVAWTHPGDPTNQPTELIPGAAISSHSAGAPGTYPRRLYPPDISLLKGPPGGETLPAGSTTVPLSLAPISGHTKDLLGYEPIEEADWMTHFGSDYQGSLFHAFLANGAGIGWLWTSLDDFPSMVIPSTSDWYYYVEDTANPQWFYRFNTSQWIRYYHTPTPELVVSTIQLPQKWDFESGLGDWSVDANNWWALDSGGTPSGNTGPSYDHTLGTALGDYVYLETSSGYAFTTGATAVFTGPTIQVANEGSAIAFYYHMYGANMGTLALQAELPDTSVVSLWSKSGQQHASGSVPYDLAEVDLSAQAGLTLQLQFLATAAGNYAGDMAIDDIFLYDYGVDTDADGMSDRFEYLSFGDFSGSAGSNLDSDGLTNLIESFLFSDPNNTTTENSSAVNLLVY